jgi:hypothetical protein
VASAPPGRAGKKRPADFACPLSLEPTSGYDVLETRSELGEKNLMRGFAIFVIAAAIYSGAHDAALAQTTTPNVTPPLVGLSTPVTSTVTNCMQSCSSQASNCQTGCVMPAPPTATPAGTVTLNASANTACTIGCTSSQLACQTNCARSGSLLGQ